MILTREQELVVGLNEGRHLVLAPPGSGKTEMLSRRILRALEVGVRPERILCATFTNRAAFEMRDRVVSAADGKTLPEVGNIHHFCYRFLRLVGRFDPTKHVLVYSGEKRAMMQVLSEDGPRLAKLKEADLITGDEKIVISTMNCFARESCRLRASPANSDFPRRRTSPSAFGRKRVRVEYR